MTKSKTPTVVSGRPEPLKRLTQKQTALWHQVVGMFAPGELGKVDSYLLHELVETYAMVKKIRPKYLKDPANNSLRLAHNGACDQLLRLYDALGISPKARHKKGNQGALKGKTSPENAAHDALESCFDRMGGSIN